MIRRFFAPIALVTLFAAFCTLANLSPAKAEQVVTSASPRCSAVDAASTTLHHAGLVVTFGDRYSATFCIEFSEDTISGLQLLQRSGLRLVTSSVSGQGAAICSIVLLSADGQVIDGDGSNDLTNCFASCTGSSCAYWAYYQFVDGAWKFSQLGAASRAVHDGDVDGWAWGPGGLSSGAVPEQPGALCPEPPSPTPIAPPATPVVVQQPSSTPMPVTLTPVPSLTSVPAPALGEATTVPSTEPSGDASVPPAREPSGDVAPTRLPENVVAGVQATLPATSVVAPSSAASGAPSPAPRTGAVVVSNEQGNANEAHSESRGAVAGGSRTSLIAFGVLILALAAVAGVVLYRRRAIG